MKVRSIRIENILSIKEAELQFPDSGLLLVEGYNYDAGRSNGAGKSSIFNALSFALFDKIPRKITASEILKRGSKSGKVTCIVEVNGEEYTVVRSRPKNVIFLKGSEVLQIGQNEWEKLIRLTYDQFVLCMYTAQGADSNKQRFLLCNDADKKNFLLQLLDLQQFSDCKKLIDEELKVVNSNINDLLLKESSILSKIAAHKEHTIDLANIDETIDRYNKKILEHCAELSTLQAIKKPDLSLYQEKENQLSRKLSDINGLRVKRSMLLEQHQKLSNKIAPYDPNASCELCGSSTHSKEAEELHNKHQASILAEMQSLTALVADIDSNLINEQQLKDALSKIRDKKNLESNRYMRDSKRINELQAIVDNLKAQISSLKEKKNSAIELDAKINALIAMSDKINKKQKDLSNEADILSTVLAAFAPTGAQAYVLDSIIDSFNETVSKYIDIVWPNVSYSLQSYKETSKGDLTAKFSEVLLFDGEAVSVGSLSGGELKALSLCVDFALLDVLSSQFGINPNPIILDEPMDGLDSIGREVVLGLLQNISQDRLIIVIDHAQELKASFTDTIKVEKRDNTSIITMN